MVLAALALAGCAHKAPAAKGDTLTGYAIEVQHAIQQAMHVPEKFAGKRCVLQLDMQRDGAINSVAAQGGDAELCEAAIAAVKKAEIPAPPTDEIYEKIKNVKLDFAL
jgi:colicin import membrane protein